MFDGNLIVSCSSSVQMKETFARSSVSCLTGSDLQSITAVRGDPCWQVTQQLHLLIEKVKSNSRVSNLLSIRCDLTALRLQVTCARQYLLISINDSVIIWPDAEVSGFLAACTGSKTPHPLEFGDITNPPHTHISCEGQKGK